MGPSHGNLVALVAVVHGADRSTAQSGLQHAVDVADVEDVLGQLLSMDFDLQLRQTLSDVGPDLGDATGGRSAHLTLTVGSRGVAVTVIESAALLEGVGEGDGLGPVPRWPSP